MNRSPETRRSLLVRIRDTNDHAAWREFVGIYAPLIHAYALRRGLQDADAADVAQQVLHSVMLSIPGFEYDPAKGSFRGWLFTVSRNHVLKNLDKRRRTPTATGDTSFQESLPQQPADSDDEAIWNREHELQVLRWAADKAKVEFRGRTWDAFRAVAMEGKQAAAVAEDLGMSVGAVYIAKSRVISCIRKIAASTEGP